MNDERTGMVRLVLSVTVTSPTRNTPLTSVFAPGYSANTL